MSCHSLALLTNAAVHSRRWVFLILCSLALGCSSPLDKTVLFTVEQCSPRARLIISSYSKGPCTEVTIERTTDGDRVTGVSSSEGGGPSEGKTFWDFSAAHAAKMKVQFLVAEGDTFCLDPGEEKALFTIEKDHAGKPTLCTVLVKVK